jgi:hemoglobin
VPSLYEHAGGDVGLRRLTEVFYASVLADPLLQPLFGSGHPDHVEHLTWFVAEAFGGPTRFTDELGFAHLVARHRGLAITEEQRQRFAELYVAALDAAGMPEDEEFRTVFAEYVDFGTRVATHNSHAVTDADLHPCDEVPRWTWPGDEVPAR